MSATETVREYYAALRAGDPLPPFFAERADLVKVGISDDVFLAWTAGDTRHEYDSRWSGTLLRGADEPTDGRAARDEDGEWRFVGMHVSAPH